MRPAIKVPERMESITLTDCAYVLRRHLEALSGVKLIGACLAAVVAVHNAEASAHQTHVPRSSPPGPPSILLKVINHGDSTTQDREPVSDGYTA